MLSDSWQPHLGKTFKRGICINCGVVLENKKGMSCPTCTKERNRARDKRSNSKRTSEHHRGYNLRAKYNVTKEWVEQFTNCPICLKELDKGNNRRRHVDHNHTTGKVRGVLCSSCNTALGKFKTVDNLVRAIAYLKEDVTSHSEN